MMLESVRVQNFRSIRDATLRLGGLTALVGANGAGMFSWNLWKDTRHKIAGGNLS